MATTHNHQGPREYRGTFAGHDALAAVALLAVTGAAILATLGLFLVRLFDRAAGVAHIGHHAADTAPDTGGIPTGVLILLGFLAYALYQDHRNRPAPTRARA